MTGRTTIGGRIERKARLRWVPLTQMRVNPLAQRDLNPARVSQLRREFMDGWRNFCGDCDEGRAGAMA